MADEIEGAPETSRREVLKNITAGSAVAAGVAGSASASESDTGARYANPEEFTQKSFNTQQVYNRIRSTISGSRLLAALVSDGLLEDNLDTELPIHQLTDSSKKGGIEKLEAPDGKEQLIVHKPLDDRKLQINIPLYGGLPKAFVHTASGTWEVYEGTNGYNAMAVEAERTVGMTSDCEGIRGCVSCIACCGITNWSEYEQLVDCPNCWFGDCKWVHADCC